MSKYEDSLRMQYLIRESNLIESVDSFDEDKRSCRAWNWLKKQDTITPAVILILHRKITLKVLPKYESGQFRRIQVYVGGYTPPASKWVEQLTYDWCMDLAHGHEPEYQDAKFMHVRFEKIHPFVDGNGRTGRMLMWWQELKQGKPPTATEFNTRHEYYKWFKESTHA